MNRILLIVFVLVPIVNFGAPLLPEGENQFVDYGRSRVDAAPYAFSIWAVIFIGMVALSIDFAGGNEVASTSLRRATAGLLIAGMASIAFVPVSLYASDFAVWLDILAHLLALIAAIYFLRRHAAQHPSSRSGRWLFAAPSLYLGWISAATVISTAGMLREAGVNVSNELATAMACTTLSVVATAAVWLAWLKDPFFAGTIVWALIAIAVQQVDYPTVRYTAVAAAVVTSLWMLFTLTKTPRFYAVSAKTP